MGNPNSMNVKHLLKSLPIRHKLLLIMMATSCAAILLMAFFIIINQAINSQRAIQQQLSTLADVLGSRSTGALTFDDPATAKEILSGLALKANVVYAVIERTDGQPFAAFGGMAALPPVDLPNEANRLTSLWHRLLSNRIRVARGIYLEKERIGTIRIVATLDQLYADLRRYLLAVTLISTVCIAVTVLIGARLQKIVSDPILQLQQAMDSVSENKDYSLRVEHSEENELGALVDGFNHMLQQIQYRDNKLAKYSTHLETIIETRTRQLTEANEKRILWLETMAQFLKHELKNSVVGVKTSLDLIERRVAECNNGKGGRRTAGDGSLDKVDTYLARARKSIANMNALLQSAADAGNLEASLYKEPLQHLDLGAAVLSHADIYSSVYPMASIRVNCRPGTVIFGNEMRLIQLLDKVVSNAVEHSDNSGPIGISVEQRGMEALLTVTNTGDALPPDKSAIFDLFVSLRSAERKTAENFGLGLYIVKLIAESHGGRVAAYDLTGKSGAVFEITFPLAVSG